MENKEVKGLFRGYRKDGKGWIYGFLATNLEGNPCIMETPIYDGDLAGKYDGLYIGMFISVIPESVGEFTRLFDREGTPIYDGDLVDFDEEEWGGEFEPEHIKLENVIKHEYCGSIADFNNFRKVINNVYERDINK